MASCITSHWGNNYSPQISLEVTISSQTSTTANLYWVLKYKATNYPVYSSVSKSYSVKIDGSTVKSGKYSIGNKTGTHTIASGTKSVSKKSSSRKVSFSLSFNFGVTWNGSYSGTRTASGSITVGASGGGSTPSPSTKPSPSIPSITHFGLQSDTDRTMYATWSWSKSNTDHYQTIWYYDTGDGIWFIGENSTTTDKQSLYTAPSNANKVRFKVKAVSKTYTKNNKTVSYWTGGWSTAKTYNFTSNPPTEPAVPTVEIDDYKLTASLDNLDVNATEIQYQIVKNDKSVFNTGKSTIVTSHSEYSCTIDAGARYKARARSVRGSLYSDWSDYSANVVAIPAPPEKITACRATSSTSVYLAWTEVENAETYDIEYTTKKEYFDGSNQTTTSTGIEFTHYELTGLETGDEYFFRVRAVNEKGNSSWSEIVSVSIGKPPAAPTTWSSSTKLVTGDPLYLYWVHNAEDGSRQTFAELEIYVDGTKVTKTVETPEGEIDEEEEETTYEYQIDTSEYDEGTQIEWRVRTAGVTKQYGDWSIQRTIDIYAPPTLALTVTDIAGELVTSLEQFPFYISATPGPNTQRPISYQVSITANEGYTGVDSVGNDIAINAGDTVYSKYFDINDPLLVEMSAGNVDLENNISYTVTVTVSMDSGLTTESTYDFTVAWVDEEYPPDARISIDPDTLAAYIGPYCVDEDENLIDNVVLSVYRREFDGSFTEIAKDIPNTISTSRTKNIIPYPYGELISTDGGISISDNGDGSITLNGTVTDVTGAFISLGDVSITETGSYFLSGCPEGGGDSTYTLVDTTSRVYDNGSGVGFDVNFTGSHELEIQIENGVVCDNLTFKPQIEKGDAATEFEAYSGPEASNTFVTDPHPSLDYARYRIVSKNTLTGTVTYYDLPGYPVNEHAVIIQWDEAWSVFDTSEESELVDPPWSGSMLKIQYNIDVSDKNSPDVSFVEYIGREHPVSYYGTQIGSTSTWSVEIPKDDIETLYAIRRLYRWMGDVYVREPSGTGYWANITVSYNVRHMETKIPISFSVTRVAGGV